MLPTDFIVDWMDARCPNWVAFCSACLMGILGLLALSFLVLLFLPSGLGSALPLIVFFSAASSGYTVWQKRKTAPSWPLRFLTLAAGLLLAIASFGLLLVLSLNLPILLPSPWLIALLFISAPAGAMGGAWLRRRYELLPE
jgi:hypothetical protein